MQRLRSCLFWLWMGTQPVQQRGLQDVYCHEPNPGICNSVIVLPTDGREVPRTGYRLTGASRGVQFDVDGDGTKEQTAWTATDSRLAFLALDRNGNGIIDNGKELFGSNTIPSSTPTYRNRGLEALLRELGRPSESNLFYQRLLLWEDANHNGISEPDEIRNFTDDYVEFENRWRADPLVYSFGNRFHYRSMVRLRDRRAGKFMVLAAAYRQQAPIWEIPAYEIEFVLGK